MAVDTETSSVHKLISAVTNLTKEISEATPETLSEAVAELRKKPVILKAFMKIRSLL